MACEKENVAVLLSTYNGTKFLGEQLASVYAQEGVAVSLLVRDDGSSDGTCALLAVGSAFIHRTALGGGKELCQDIPGISQRGLCGADQPLVLVKDDIVKADWNETDETSNAFILNKPVVITDDEINEICGQSISLARGVLF